MEEETNHPFRNHLVHLLQTYELKLEDLKDKPVTEWKGMVKKKVKERVYQLAEQEMKKQNKLRNCGEVKRFCYMTQMRYFEAVKTIPSQT